MQNSSHNFPIKQNVKHVKLNYPHVSALFELASKLVQLMHLVFATCSKQNNNPKSCHLKDSYRQISEN